MEALNDIGVYGLGVMGASLARNLASRGHILSNEFFISLKSCYLRIAQDLAQYGIHARRHSGQAAADIDRSARVHPFAQGFARGFQPVLHVDALMLVARELGL